MRIQIKSKQIYENHEEEIIEDKEEVLIDERSTKIIIQYIGGEIILDEFKQEMILVRDNGTMVVQKCKRKKNQYKTPYGDIFFETYGKEIKIQKNPLKVVIKYQITLPQGNQYLNIIEIVEM